MSLVSLHAESVYLVGHCLHGESMCLHGKSRCLVSQCLYVDSVCLHGKKVLVIICQTTKFPNNKVLLYCMSDGSVCAW